MDYINLSRALARKGLGLKPPFRGFEVHVLTILSISIVPESEFVTYDDGTIFSIDTLVLDEEALNQIPSKATQ